ncbi:MAG TPA: porin family protein [Puia sp.]|nr:porin family protein [Puia sp.]
MKTLLVVFVIGLCCIAIQSKAQQVELGLKAGLNVADLHSNAGNYDHSARASAYAGGLAHIHLSQHIAFQPELVYSSQGAKTTFGDASYTLRLNYINLPLLFQYMIGDGFRLQTGPQVGLLAAAKLKSGGTTQDVKGDYTTGDFSWIFGTSYLLPSGLGFDMRYNLGINNIDNTGSTSHLFNRVFQLGLFYQFRHPTVVIKEK